MFMGIPFLTSTELAIRWKLTRKTIEKWRCAGKSPPYKKIGGRILYKTEDIKKFEDEAERHHTSMTEAPFLKSA